MFSSFLIKDVRLIRVVLVKIKKIFAPIQPFLNKITLIILTMIILIRA